MNNMKMELFLLNRRLKIFGHFASITLNNVHIYIDLLSTRPYFHDAQAKSRHLHHSLIFQFYVYDAQIDFYCMKKCLY